MLCNLHIKVFIMTGCQLKKVPEIKAYLLYQLQTVHYITCFRNLVTVSVKITQWGEGVISVNLDITIYQLKILMAAKVNNFIIIVTFTL